jgi:hypothetical protein
MSFDPKEMIAAQRAKLLWCVHVLGPDDLYAAPSYEAAEKHVEELTAALFTERTAKLDVLCLPIVAMWPYSPETHAADLKSNGLFNGDRTPRAKGPR